jgi:hypothetical protein
MALPAVEPNDAPDPWHSHRAPVGLGGAGYARLLEQLRRLQDSYSGAFPPLDELDALAAEIGALADRFDAWQVGEKDGPVGTRHDLPGRGQPALPAWVAESATDLELSGRVTFGRFFLGGGGAVHGGMLPLLFDDVLGRLANMADRPVARTAYLKVDYRAITRVGVEHRVTSRIDRMEGRKRWITGELVDPAGVVTAQAEGLFVQLLPGQP